MTQLITEQVLVVVQASREAEGPERTVALGQEISDIAGDEDSNELVVQSPPCLVGASHGHFDEAHRVVDDGSRDGERATTWVARDQKRHLRPCELCRPGEPHARQIGIGHRGVPRVDDLERRIKGCGRVADRLTPDSGGRRPSQVGPQRLAAAAAQIVGVMLREDQYPSAKPILRQDTEESLAEVRAERSPG